jgi:phosphate transport system substrate-binding protein
MTYPGNRVENVSLDQLRKIYSGKISNWRDLGGEERGIVPLTREPGSAIHATFIDRLFGKGSEGREKAFTIRASKEKILKTIKRIAGCVGYGIVRPEEAESQGIRVLSVEGRAPTADNIGGGLYPLTRPQLLVARQEPDPLVREWMVSFAAFVKRSSAP